MSARFLLVPASVLALACLGCATEGPAPQAELTRAQALVDQADKGAAQHYAAADLQRAHEELTAADSAESAHHYEAARRYAESAAVDADLAQARGQAGEAQKAAHEIHSGNQELRSEANRAADAPVAAPPPPVQDTPN
ncbi:MAG TPA: DUF4398 domain-containing protein [Steroidobacteraceae bacterium]|jgi:hypothetical protein